MQRTKVLILSLFLVLSYCSAQQVMVNLEWQAATGNPSQLIDYSASAFDDSGRLIVVGNTLTNGESENFLISKFDPDGGLLWQQEYNFSDSDSTDFATAVICDQYNNIYVTGGSYDNTSGSFDYATLKLDASGNFVWQKRFDGQDNLDDIPSAIGIDYQGNVYVTGGSQSQANAWDYLTIKYDYTGMEQWSVSYDYAQKDDFASEIQVEQGSGQLTIVGGSASSATAWDFAVLQYDSDGNWQATEREASGIGTFDKPMAFYQDNAGNMYITGSKSGNGTDFDILTIKLNAHLQLKWTKTFNGHNMEDGAYDVIADPQGNVYVAGYTQKSNLGMNFLILKYDSTGTLEWSKERTPYYPQDSAQATEIALDISGNVYASGYIQDQGDKDILSMRFDPTGQSGWEKVFKNIHDPNEYATDLLVDIFGNAYVTGKSIDLATSSYILLHYSSHEREIVLMTDSNNMHEFARNELIFRVAPQYLKLDKIDNTDILFGTVDDFLQSELRNQMADKLGLGTAIAGTAMYKLCPFLTRADTLSVLPNGDSIRNPNYYATFVLSLPLPQPEQNPEDFIAASEAVDSLMSLYPMVWVAEVCGVYEADADSGANDPEYNNSFGVGQQSLHDLNPYSLNWPSDINVEPAWTLIYNGSANPHIKVGVIDLGTLWSHEDLKIDQTDTTRNPANSKIKGGFNFTKNVPIYNPNSFNTSHGNGVSGIIGALRNNLIGVAGIAGGDMRYNDTGADLFDYVVLDSNTIGLNLNVGLIIQAINRAVMIDSVNILNMSFGGNTFSFFEWEVIQMTLKHQVTIVSSRGNDDSDDKRYPSCYPGVIGVGSTDEYGRRFFFNNQLGGLKSDSSYSGLTNYFGSNFGPGLDLMAPGVSSIIRTLTGRNGGSYAAFWGTSAAAPHVSGVTAILQRFQKTQKEQVLPSQSPVLLAPEDIQRIMEITAMDIDPNIPGQAQSYAQPGKDYVTGYGLVNAGNALYQIKWPDYFIEHVETTGFQSQVVDSLDAFLEMSYKSSILNKVFSQGDYFVKVNKVNANIPYTPPPGYHIDEVGNMALVWPRNSSSDGWNAPQTDRFLAPSPTDPKTFPYFLPTPHLTIDSVSSGAIHISTYFYELAPDPFNPTLFLFWPEEFDSGTRPPKFAVSVLLESNALGIDRVNDDPPVFDTYPNPTQDYLNVSFTLLRPHKVNIRVHGMDGRTMHDVNLGLNPQGQHVKKVSLRELPAGMYFIELRLDKKSYFQKIIKL